MAKGRGRGAGIGDWGLGIGDWGLGILKIPGVGCLEEPAWEVNVIIHISICSSRIFSYHLNGFLVGRGGDEGLGIGRTDRDVYPPVQAVSKKVDSGRWLERDEGQGVRGEYKVEEFGFKMP